ncbi:MAG: hypothetical protein M3Q44_04495 [bacterium]|nr:hypothetical protein [bacterium]
MSSPNKKEIFYTEELPIEIDFSDADIKSAEEKLNTLQLDRRDAFKEDDSEATIRLAGLQAYYSMRESWSWILAALLTLSIIFQFVMIIIVGKEWLDFSQNKDFLLLVTGENFVQIIGLCLIIVNFLFPKQPKI